MPSFEGSDLRRLIVLGSVIEHLDSGNEQATPGALMIDPSDEAERATLSADVYALGDQGLLNVDKRFSGGWSTRPTQAGRDAWSDFSRQRANGVARRRQLRNDYLGWIYQESSSGSSPTVEGFLESEAAYLGDAYILGEVENAGEWLAERRFIKGPGAWGKTGPILPQHTAKGEDYVENERDVHVEPRAVGSTTSYTVNGPAQIAHDSHHVNQVQNIDSLRDDARELAAALRQLSSLTSEGIGADVILAAAGLEEEADGEARPHRLRTIAEGAQRALGSGVGGAVGSLISKQLTDFLGSLPL